MEIVADDAVNGQVQLLTQLLKLASLISGPMQDGVAVPSAIGLNEVKIIVCLGGEGALAGHDLSEKLAMTTMNVSRALNALLERGWIEPVIDPANRRRKPYKLSDAGWGGYRAMTPDVGRVAAQVFATLSKSETTAFARIMNKIIERIEDRPAG
jgi:DNA-binding MarR family transcriptional regulator